MLVADLVKWGFLGNIYVGSDYPVITEPAYVSMVYIYT